MKLAGEAVEKVAEVLIHLGEASIIGGVGFVAIDSSKWYIGVGGVFVGAGFIIYGISLIHKLKNRNE